MRLPPVTIPRTLALPLAVVLVAAACSGAAPSAAPATPTAEPPTPVIATPTPAPEGATFWLRMTTWQAIPPEHLFGFTPAALITADGRYLVPGAVPAIYPGPLVAPYFARRLSDAGRQQILAWADELGLLSGDTDFTGDLGLPGGITGRIELTVDGRVVTLAGIPDAQGDPTPGSPAAFAVFWQRVAGLPQQIQSELGPEEPWVPEAYAVLVGPAPTPEPGLEAGIADWPLDVAVGDFGGPVLDGSRRCGLVEGADAATLRPVVEAANQLTQWVQDPDTSAAFGLVVRPIAAGENPCAEVFGF